MYRTAAFSRGWAPRAGSGPAIRLALEASSLLELPALLSAMPYLATAPRGDGHPVVVIPGFGADDRSTVAIRRFLGYLGYDVQGWRRGRNVRRAGADLPAVAAQVQRLAGLHDAPVSLIGWSRGGVLAREVARQHPRAVRSVITLASPIANASGPFGARPVPVPSTSIYTRCDGVLAWRRCLEPAGPRRENIEVRSTHSGIGFHPPTLWAIAERLAQPRGGWRPFRPPGLLGAFFPRPEHV